MIWLSTLGAIVGFIGGGIVLFDRYYKWRPIASLSMMDDEGTRRICIRIKNTTPYDIAILELVGEAAHLPFSRRFEHSKYHQGDAGQTTQVSPKAR
jgi:hypothetical protein